MFIPLLLLVIIVTIIILHKKTHQDDDDDDDLITYPVYQEIDHIRVEAAEHFTNAVDNTDSGYENNPDGDDRYD